MEVKGKSIDIYYHYNEAVKHISRSRITGFW